MQILTGMAWSDSVIIVTTFLKLRRVSVYEASSRCLMAFLCVMRCSLTTKSGFEAVPFPVIYFFQFSIFLVIILYIIKETNFFVHFLTFFCPSNQTKNLPNRSCDFSLCTQLYRIFFLMKHSVETHV